MDSHWQVAKAGNIIVSTTPEGLWEDACKYFKWCDEHPIILKRAVLAGKGAGGQLDEVRTRPYSVKALCLHCGITEEYLRSIRNSKQEDSIYYIVISKILYIIYTQNVEHATVGEFNAIFTSKVLGIAGEDAPQGATKIEIVSGLPALSNSENEVLEKLEFENWKKQKDKEKNA